MAKASPKNGTHKNVVNLSAKKTALGVNAAYPQTRGRVISGGVADYSIKQTWEKLTEISNEIGQWIAQMAQDISDSVELVKRYGCKHIAEFNATVAKTNTDFTKFIGDYEKVKEKHASKTGLIESPDDLALALQVFEDYNQFRAYFNGVMHHSLISFTEYALEAKDRYSDILREEEALAAAQAASEVAVKTEEPTEEAKNV